MKNIQTKESRHWYPGLIILTLAYPLTHIIVHYIPNPVVPSANIALNMMFPILAGYFYGPVSGAIAGALGTGISAILAPDLYDAMSILPHAIMGIAAGYTGAGRNQLLTGLTVLIGHTLNVFVYWRFNLLVIDHLNTLFLGIITETTIDLVAIILAIVLLHKRLYKENIQRW